MQAGTYFILGVDNDTVEVGRCNELGSGGHNSDGQGATTEGESDGAYSKRGQKKAGQPDEVISAVECG